MVDGNLSGWSPNMHKFPHNFAGGLNAKNYKLKNLSGSLSTDRMNRVLKSRGGQSEQENLRPIVTPLGGQLNL